MSKIKGKNCHGNKSKGCHGNLDKFDISIKVIFPWQKRKVNFIAMIFYYIHEDTKNVDWKMLWQIKCNLFHGCKSYIAMASKEVNLPWAIVKVKKVAMYVKIIISIYVMIKLPW